MFKVLILVCAAHLAPSECQPGTALEVLQGPEARNEIACALQSQAYLAQTALGRELRSDEYVKVRCRRTSIGKSTVG